MSDVSYKNQTFAIALGRGEPLMVKVPVPVGPTDLVRVLPSLFAIADEVFSMASKGLEEMGKTISCGPACGVCCNQLVTISQPEALYLLGFLETLEPERKERYMSRFRTSWGVLEHAGIMPRLLAAFEHNVHQKKELLAVQAEYFSLAQPCPFLEEGSCSIYPHRPILCRQYSVTSPPANCASVYSGVHIEKVLHPMDLAAATAAFDGVDAARSHALPMILAPFLAPRLTRIKWPEQEAGRMLATLLNYASQFYKSDGR